MSEKKKSDEFLLGMLVAMPGFIEWLEGADMFPEGSMTDTTEYDAQEPVRANPVPTGMCFCGKCDIATKADTALSAFRDDGKGIISDYVKMNEFLQDRAPVLPGSPFLVDEMIAQVKKSDEETKKLYASLEDASKRNMALESKLMRSKLDLYDLIRETRENLDVIEELLNEVEHTANEL